MEVLEKITLTLRTTSPLLLATTGGANVLTVTQDHIPGTVLRGILAARYIEQQELGTAAQDDASFLHLFFQSLRFVDATIVRDGRAALPVPASLQRQKDGNDIIDLVHEAPRAGFKSMRGYAVVREEKKELVPAFPHRSIRFHMSRSGLQKPKKNVAPGAERLAGSSHEGGIYSYESIDAGETFEGAIYGTRSDLEALCAGLGGDGTYDVRLGRSRTTQYGSAVLALSVPDPLPAPTVPDGPVTLCLATPLITDTLAESSDAAQSLQHVADAMNVARQTKAFHIATGSRSIFARTEAIDSFVGVWGLRRPRSLALAAGSTFVIEKDGAWDEKDAQALQHLAHHGIGARCAEGFGQLYIWPDGTFTIGSAADDSADSSQPARRTIENATVRQKAASILKTRYAEQIRLLAARDAGEALKNSGTEDGTTHFFARLDALLGLGRKSLLVFHSDLAADIEKAPDGPFAKRLQSIRIGTCSLKELLLDSALAKMPYASIDTETVFGTNFSEAAEDLGIDVGTWKNDERFFTEYWHWFFRYARKSAGKKEGEPA